MNHLSRSPVPRLTFIRPFSPSAAVRPPQGDDWLHKPKCDGFRFQIIKDGGKVRFYSRHGREYTDRKLPRNRPGLWRLIRAVIATS